MRRQGGCSLTRVKFKIGPHRGFTASTRPANAIDLLWQRLGASRDDVRFARTGTEITASWEGEPPSSALEERAEIGRLVVLEIVRQVCENAPELELDWFAVGAERS